VVVAPGPEPAVVEHVPLDAERGGALGEVDEAVGVVVEVDGLPDVQGHGPLSGRRMGQRP